MYIRLASINKLYPIKNQNTSQYMDKKAQLVEKLSTIMNLNLVV